MRKLLALFVFLLLFSSCGLLNQNNMFQTGSDYQYAEKPDSNVVVEYKISENDVLSFTIYSNDGFQLIDLTAFSSGGTIDKTATENLYLTDSDGQVKLPLLGRIKLSGLTIREAEQQLEEKYSEFYIKPFITIKVLNRKVILFPGSTGNAQTIPLQDNNTTLIDVIAMAGGIPDDGKAKRVKLIREVNNNREVFLIDLSTIKGINDAFMVLQANDIIYIEPRKRISAKVLKEMVPLLSLLSTTVLTITLINNGLKK